MLSLTGAKVLTMVLTGVVPFCLGLLPRWVSNTRWVSNSETLMHKIVVSCLLCFGGGVLLATSQVHMQMEVIENLKLGTSAGSFEGLGEVLICAGFLLIYLIEELVHVTCDRYAKHDHCQDDHTQSIKVHRTFAIRQGDCEADELVGEHERRHLMDQYQIATEDGTNDEINTDGGYNTFGSGNDSSHGIERRGSVNNRNTTIRDFLTVMALSLHAVFEGLAVGLESDVGKMWTLFAAVSLHKYVLSFCVGLELWTSGKNTFAINISYILVYAIMSPIGIGIGIAVTALQAPSPSYFLSVGVLQAIAGGTILYVVVFEVLQRERSKTHVPGLLQLLFVALGFATMTLVEVYA